MKIAWIYNVKIKNKSQSTIQLLSRHWQIIDYKGKVNEIAGVGVIGEQPVIKSGEVFKYTSGTYLNVPSGIMQGFTEINAIQEVEFLSTIMDPEVASDKQSIVDVLCKDSHGNRYIAEMQLARDKGFEKRAQLYAAKAYSRQLDKSGNYIDLKKVFFIAISNCNLLPEEVDYISTHNIRDIKTNGHYLKDFQFVFIELPKFAKNKVEQLESIVERWCFFFKYAEETTEEDLKEIAEKAPIIKLAYDELDKFRWNEKDLVAYEERIMDLRKEEAILEYRLDLAEEKGIQKGIEKGKIEGKIEVAKAMLANNVDVNTIVKFTGLSISEIEELSGNL